MEISTSWWFLLYFIVNSRIYCLFTRIVHNFQGNVDEPASHSWCLFQWLLLMVNSCQSGAIPYFNWDYISNWFFGEIIPLIDHICRNNIVEGCLPVDCMPFQNSIVKCIYLWINFIFRMPRFILDGPSKSESFTNT